MDIDSDMAVSINWGSFKRELWGSLKGGWVDIRQVFKSKLILVRAVWLFLHIGGPFCGRPCHTSHTTGGSVRAPNFWSHAVGFRKVGTRMSALQGDMGPYEGHSRLCWNVDVRRFVRGCPSIFGLGLEDGQVPTFWLLLWASRIHHAAILTLNLWGRNNAGGRQSMKDVLEPMGVDANPSKLKGKPFWAKQISNEVKHPAFHVSWSEARFISGPPKPDTHQDPSVWV